MACLFYYTLLYTLARKPTENHGKSNIQTHCFLKNDSDYITCFICVKMTCNMLYLALKVPLRILLFLIKSLSDAQEF